MPSKILKKKYLEENVLTAARKRIAYLYELYDRVVVNFSGGKDSTAVLYLCREYALKHGFEVDVIYVDHEIEGENTIAFIEEVAQLEGINLKVICQPFILRNAASSTYPYWVPWNPLEKDLWVREKPKDYITIPRYEEQVEYDKDYVHPLGEPYKAEAVLNAPTFQDLADAYREEYKRQGFTSISLIGLRAAESLSRYRVLARRDKDSYISGDMAYPVYDWTATDVWKWVKETGLPHNREYDLLNRTKLYDKLERQRVGSIFAEESLRGLELWRLMYGDYWAKILDRAEGVKTAWRYCNTGIYTGTRIEKPDHLRWSEYLNFIVDLQAVKVKALSKVAVQRAVKWHKGRTDYPISENEKDACPLTGVSWERLCKMAIRGDTKSRGFQSLQSVARKLYKKKGLTEQECVNQYGSRAYIKKYWEQRNKRKKQ